MKNLNNLGHGVALATSTLALGSVLAISSSISSAQAATFGTINIVGEAIISNLTDPSPENDTISFVSPFTTVSASGGFSGLVANSISTINLESLEAGLNTFGTTLTPYSATIPTPFISFVDGSTFVVDNLPVVGRNFTASALGNIVGYSFPELQGTLFTNTGEFMSAGVLTANQINATDIDGSFSFTLTSGNTNIGQPVSEPANAGALVALGIGAFLTKNLAKKSKAKVTA
ncbi:hypothetical protein [Anabaena sp. CCY 9402-a]|uniref:hypothetical protein n=1 Tax=Anabaena sp. CCY 9402-a TaxID=3103867 RepID=UPI0039C62703